MLNAGDTAWLLTATTLVLFMTLPGLRLVLWRAGASAQRAFGLDALLCDRLLGLDLVAHLRL